MHRFFGYGSLVNEATHAYPGLTAARISGWRRRWSHRVQRNDACVSSLTIIPSPGTSIAGAIADVPDGDWAALDAREHGYERRILAPEQLEPPAENISFYRSLRKNDQLGTPDFPILQSYLDCVLQGFLHMHGPDGPADFIASTDGWDTPILQDRNEPLYPRAITLSKDEIALFDHLLEDMPKLA